MTLFKCLLTSIAVVSASCNNDKATKANAETLKLEEENRRQAKILEKKEAEEKAEKKAALKRSADEAVKALEAEELKLKLAQDKLVEEERLEAERIEKERLQHEKILIALRKKQKVGRAKYVGTKYESLTIKSKEYKNLTVTRATDSHVIFLHSGGVAIIDYNDLSKEIRDVCVYDPRTIIKEQPKKRAQKKKIASSNTRKKSTLATNPRKTTPQPKKNSSTKKVKAPRPRGFIRTRVVRTYRKFEWYNERKIYNHYKDLSISANANVDAVLYFNGKRVLSLPAKKTQVFTGTSLRKGKYTIELRDQNGKVLDRESNSRKSGL